MDYPTPPVSPVTASADNMHITGEDETTHAYPPAQVADGHEDSRHSSWRYGKYFSTGIFSGTLGLFATEPPQTKTPAQMVIEQYKADQFLKEEEQQRKAEQLLKEKEQAARMRMELEMNEQKAQQQELAFRPLYAPPGLSMDPESMDEDAPPPVPPKDFPAVPPTASRAGTLETLPEAPLHDTTSWVHRDSYDTEDTMDELESGPKVRFSISRRECLGIARQEAIQTVIAAGTNINIPCNRAGCEDILANIDALTTHIDVHNLASPGVATYVCLTCKSSFATNEEKIIHRRDCGLKTSIPPPSSPTGFVTFLRYLAKSFCVCDGGFQQLTE